MITVGKLRELLRRLPDGARVSACEQGDGNGLIVRYGNKSGWIEIGYSPGEASKHDLEKIELKESV